MLNSPRARLTGDALDRRSPSWLRRTAHWVWGPNIGLLLHLCRLLLVAASGTGLIRTRPYYFDVTSMASRRWSVMVIKTLILTAESYDLHAFLAVTLLLDFPVFLMFYRRLRMPYALGHMLPPHLISSAVVALYGWWRTRAAIRVQMQRSGSGIKSPLAASATGAASPGGMTKGKAKLQ